MTDLTLFYSEIFDPSAGVEHTGKIENIRTTIAKLFLWLHMHGIDPFGITLEMDLDETDESGDLRIVFGIEGKDQPRYIEVGEDFFLYAAELMPLPLWFQTKLYSGNFDPSSLLCHGGYKGRALIDIPADMSSVRYAFPPLEFWNKRAEQKAMEAALEHAHKEGAFRRRSGIRLVHSDGVPVNKEAFTSLCYD